MPDQIDNKYRVASDFSAITNARPVKKRKRENIKRGPLKHFSDFIKETASGAEADQIAFDSTNMSPEDDATLIRLQDEVFSRGDVLKNKITLETIKDYKQAVANFLAYFVSHTYDFKETPKRRTSFRPPKSSTIKLINEKLEKLANEVFRNQAKQLDILEQVDEIKGLIIDLLH